MRYAPLRLSRPAMIVLAAVAGSLAHADDDQGRDHARDHDREPPQKELEKQAEVGVSLTDGEEPIELRLSALLALETYAGTESPAQKRLMAPSWRRDAGGMVAELADPESGVRATLRIEGLAAGGAALAVEVRYTRRTRLGRSALEMTLPGKPQMLGRNLEARSISSTTYLDRFASKALRLGEIAVQVDDGIDGLVVKRAGGKTALQVELFSTEARPFRYQTRCRDDWRQDNHEVALKWRLREAGERDVARIELRASEAQVLVKARYPEGRQAALVITDHADQSAPETFAALARGRSDTIKAIGGIVGNGLVITKSLFLRGEMNGEGRRQLEDSRVAAVAEEMARIGSEIIPHSVTPEADDRALTAEGLDRFDRFHPSTWIDHQPQTNCEAFTNQGWRGAADLGAARWRIADLLASHGYRFIWAGFDIDELDLLRGGSTEKRALTLWPVGRLAPGDPDDRWLFATTWAFLEHDAFYRMLATEKLDRLERDHGLSILHTYLESLHLGDDNPRFAGRNVLLKKNGVIETDPRMEKVWADLKARIDRGTLWMPTLAGLGEYLRSLDRVRVRQAGGGAALVVSPVAVAGLTLAAAGRVEVLVDGKAPRGRREEAGSTVFWFDLPAARPVRISVVPLREANVAEQKGRKRNEEIDPAPAPTGTERAQAGIRAHR